MMNRGNFIIALAVVLTTFAAYGNDVSNVLVIGENITLPPSLVLNNQDQKQSLSILSLFDENFKNQNFNNIQIVRSSQLPFMINSEKLNYLKNLKFDLNKVNYADSISFSPIDDNATNCYIDVNAPKNLQKILAVLFINFFHSGGLIDFSEFEADKMSQIQGANFTNQTTLFVCAKTKISTEKTEISVSTLPITVSVVGVKHDPAAPHFQTPINKLDPVFNTPIIR